MTNNYKVLSLSHFQQGAASEALATRAYAIEWALGLPGGSLQHTLRPPIDGSDVVMVAVACELVNVSLHSWGDLVPLASVMRFWELLERLLDYLDGDGAATRDLLTGLARLVDATATKLGTVPARSADGPDPSPPNINETGPPIRTTGDPAASTDEQRAADLKNRIMEHLQVIIGALYELQKIEPLIGGIDEHWLYISGEVA
jgi:hypothetical protein